MTRAKILNVDDQHISRYIRTQVLEQAGYEVLEAATGDEALRRLSIERPQLVLLDMNLPDMIGVEVCRRIRAEPSTRSVVVLHISATQTSLQDRVYGLDGGADGYLVEPVEPDLLLATVRSALRLWEAEAKLEESLAETRAMAARYQSLTDAVPHLVYAATAQGQWDYVSQQFTHYTGRETTEALETGWLSLVHPEDRQCVADAWAHSIEQGTAFETEYRFLRADGSYRWHLARARPVRAGDGAITQWVGTSTDIQERRILNEEMRRRHREFVALAEHSPDIIARYDRNLRYNYVNRAIPGFSQICLEQCFGKTNWELGWPEHMCTQWDEVCRQVLATGQPKQLEFSDDLPGGKRYFHARIVPEVGADGTVESVLAITPEVTERKNAEIALRESERKLRRLVESNVIGVVFLDSERITAANNVFLEMLGYTREDLQAGRLILREMTPPEFWDRDDQAIEETRYRGACRPYEKEYVRKDGERVPILLGAAALDGSAPAWVGFVLDLRQLKETEAALRRTNNALERSNEDLAQFAYAASHDLQEPLRTVLSYTELLARQYTDNLDERARTYMAFTEGAARRMQSLIHDILAFASVQNTDLAGDVTIESKGMVQLAMANLKNAIEESGALIYCGELPSIRAEAGQLSQMFQNLISNSIKYRNPAEPPRIEISALEEGDQWLFCVRDNGIGFDQKYAERIFGVLKRLHGSAIPGTGIGLAIVKKIVERHGGKIWAESQPGKGAAFYIRLPGLKGEAASS